MSEVADSHRNYIGSYRKLADHAPGGSVRESGGVFAFVTGLPAALFNGCVVVADPSPEELTASLDWVRERGLPYQVAIVDEHLATLRASLTAAGLQPYAVFPGMVLSPVPEAPAPATGVSVVRGIEGDMASYLPGSFQADPDVRTFTGTVDGQPAGTSIAIRTDDVSGVYGVGTEPAARNRGVGTAVTWAAVGAGRAWGCDAVYLQATAMGAPLYRRMGFRRIVDYAIYR